MSIVTEASNSQIDTSTYLPLIMVKNGLMANLFSNGILDSSQVKNLILPKATYPYLLKITIFTKQSDTVNGAYKYSSVKYYNISPLQTSVDISSNGLAFYEANLTIKQ